MIQDDGYVHGTYLMINTFYTETKVLKLPDNILDILNESNKEFKENYVDDIPSDDHDINLEQTLTIELT